MTVSESLLFQCLSISISGLYARPLGYPFSSIAISFAFRSQIVSKVKVCIQSEPKLQMRVGMGWMHRTRAQTRLRHYRKPETKAQEKRCISQLRIACNHCQHWQTSEGLKDWITDCEPTQPEYSEYGSSLRLRVYSHMIFALLFNSLIFVNNIFHTNFVYILWLILLWFEIIM